MRRRLKPGQRLSFAFKVTELAACPGGLARTLIDSDFVCLLRSTFRALRESLIFTRATPSLFALAVPRARNLTLLARTFAFTVTPTEVPGARWLTTSVIVLLPCRIRRTWTKLLRSLNGLSGGGGGGAPPEISGTVNVMSGVIAP